MNKKQGKILGLRMLYVDYDGHRNYDNKRGKTVWWDPNFVWQLIPFEDFDTNLSFKTKYDALKKDLETAITHFRFSQIYDVICKAHPKKKPRIKDIQILLDYHFLLKNTHTQQTIGIEKDDIVIYLTPQKSQSWINESLLNSIRKELKSKYPEFSSEVQFFEKNH